jgi:pimeloyl-ACP methyl ester carboxylesterase
VVRVLTDLRLINDLQAIGMTAWALSFPKLNILAMKQNSKTLVGTLIAAGMALPPSITVGQTGPFSEAIRPFTIQVRQKELSELRKRIKETRWPDKEVVADQSQGVQLAMIQKLAHYWSTAYDWRKAEEKLNGLPQFMTTIDGVDIHFIHVRSKYPNALPMIMTHGWPGSIFECLGIIGPLTNPTAYGATPDDAFDIVIPSMPGFGFSGKPTTTGWNSDQIAHAWDVLMKRLGYTHYVAQGGDAGAWVCESMARLAPSGLAGIHMNLLVNIPPEINRSISAGDPPPAELSADEKIAYDQRQKRTLGYFLEQASRPQTIGYSLAETPVGLAAWLLDHDPKSYEKMDHAVNGHPDGGLTLDAILDDITLYWLTNTGASAARLYWDQGKTSFKGQVMIPTAFSVFPDESFLAPRSWVEKTHSNLIYYHKVEKGGHFAAWEEPQLMAEELRAAFRPLR